MNKLVNKLLSVFLCHLFIYHQFLLFCHSSPYHLFLSIMYFSIIFLRDFSLSVICFSLCHISLLSQSLPSNFLHLVFFLSLPPPLYLRIPSMPHVCSSPYHSCPFARVAFIHVKYAREQGWVLYKPFSARVVAIPVRPLVASRALASGLFPFIHPCPTEQPVSSVILALCHSPLCSIFPD